MPPEIPEPAPEEKPAREGLISALHGLTIGGKAEIGIFVLALLYTIYIARSLLLPIFLALLLAALLQPLVQKLLRWRIPESIGAAVVVLVFVAALGTTAYELSSPVSEWVEGGPLLLRKAEYKVERLRQSLRKAREKTEQIEQMTDLEGGKEKVVVKGPSLSHRILSQTWVVLGTAAVVFALVYFLLAQGRQTLFRLASGLRGKDTGEMLTAVLVNIQQDIAAYLRTVIVINTAVGVFTGRFHRPARAPEPDPDRGGGGRFELHPLPWPGGHLRHHQRGLPCDLRRLAEDSAASPGLHVLHRARREHHNPHDSREPFDPQPDRDFFGHSVLGVGVGGCGGVPGGADAHRPEDYRSKLPLASAGQPGSARGEEQQGGPRRKRGWGVGRIDSSGGPFPSPDRETVSVKAGDVEISRSGPRPPSKLYFPPFLRTAKLS